jgi:hypothetical protein
MRIKKVMLAAIRGNKDLRKSIKKTLDISEPTLYRLLTENGDDLTKAAVLKLIRDEFRVSDDEILEDAPTVVDSK